MPKALTILLDQNIPIVTSRWLQKLRPSWTIHHVKEVGIIRLKVWPTTVEETQNALERLLTEIDDEELTGALVIIDRSRIRIRPGK